MFLNGIMFAFSIYLLLVVSFGEFRIGSYEVSKNGIVRFALMFVLSVVVILSCVSAYTEKKLSEYDRETETAQQNIRYNELNKKYVELQQQKSVAGFDINDLEAKLMSGELKIVRGESE